MLRQTHRLARPGSTGVILVLASVAVSVGIFLFVAGLAEHLDYRRLATVLTLFTLAALIGRAR